MAVIPKKMVALVIARDGGFCQLALAGCLGEATVADHRADRGHGGSKTLNDPAALVAACGLCNGAKTEAHSLILLDLIERGLRVPKDSTNAKTLTRCRVTPMQDLAGDWWFLLSDGTRQLIEEPEF